MPPANANAMDRTLKRSKRRKYSGIAGLYSRNRGPGRGNLYYFSSSYWGNIFNRCKQHKKRHQFRFIDSRGASSIEILIYITLLIFFVFGSVDFTVTLLRYMQAEQIKETYLDRMRTEGWLSIEAFEEMQERYNNIGISIVGIEGSVQNGVENLIPENSLTGSFIDEPITRNVENINESRIILNMELKPGTNPFISGRLLGKTEDEDFVFRLGGVVYSELPG